jgi:(p)ppGpp synthase/HD superfamily hydrolase
MKLTPRLKRAIDVASTAHKAQFRGDKTTPYVSHLFGVALQLANYTSDEDVVIAGLLHDVLEDVDTDIYSANDLKRDFGERVLGIVQGVTEDKSVKDPQERRKLYLMQLETDTLESLMVSAADLTHNLMSNVLQFKATGKVHGSWNAKPEFAHWYWATRIATIKKRLDGGLVDDLEAAYQEFKDVIG